VTEVVYVNLETNEVHRVGDTAQAAELPDGTYLEQRTIKAGDQVSTKTRQVEISGSQLEGLSTTDYRLTVGHDNDEYEVSYEPGSTVDLWIGASNDTAPVANVDVNVTVRRPDGTQETFQKTIGESGHATLSYDTAGKGTGQYDVFVESPNGRTVWGEFIVGQQIKEIYPGIGDTTTVGSEVTAAVLVTENASPVANAETSVTIQAPDGSEETRSVTTDEDGFAYLNFTVDQEGRYYIDADNFYNYFSITAADYTVHQRVNGEEYSSEARPGAPFNYAAQLQSDAGAAEDVSVTVQMVRDPYGDEEVVKNYSATSDANGMVYFEGTIPEDASDGTEYEFEISTSDEKTIAGESADLYVSTAEDDESTSERLRVDIEPARDVIAPGQSVDLTVSAEVYGDETTPYANEELTLRPTIEFGEYAVGTGFTVQTNDSGEATVTYTVPDLPEGTELEFTADRPAEYNKSNFGVGYNQIDVQEYKYEDDWDSPSEAGGDARYHVTVTDVTTGEPVTDFPVMIAAERSAGEASVYATRSLYTNSTGSVTASIETPADATGEHHFGTFSRYEDSGSFPVVDIPTFDASISGIESLEYAAGETITATYDGPTGTTAVVAVETYVETAPSPIKTARVAAGEEFSFTLPSSAPEGTYYSVSGFALNGDGQIANLDSEWVQISESTSNSPPSASFSYDPSEPDVSETVSFDASASEDGDGSIVAYEWDFTGDGVVDATGETATYQYESAGTYEVTLTVSDGDGATDSVTKSISVTDTSDSGVTPVLEPSNVSVSPSGTATVDIVMEGAQNIAAYEFSLSLSEGSVGEISGIELNGGPGVQNVSIAEDGQSATASAALASVDGAEGEPVATVELVGESSGETTLSATIDALGNESGIEYELSKNTASATVSVEAGPGDVTGNGKAATDPDGDGVYEDINGDGTANVLDVQSLFGNLDSDSVQGNAAFDINGDGSVDILDVQALFTQL
jgi:PKD repeat protein